MHKTTLKPRPSGFTLIELIVVITLLLILISMSAALWPKFNEREKVRKAADLVQEWLLTAKQTAKRDGQPRGLRFEIDANGQCSTIYYIEQLPDFKSGVLTVQPGVAAAFFTANAPASGPVQAVDLTNGYNPGPPFGPPPNNPLWAVLPGDRLEILVDSGIFANSAIPLRPSPVKVCYDIGSVLGPIAAGVHAVTLVTPVQPLRDSNGGVDTLGSLLPPDPDGEFRHIFVSDTSNITIGTKLILDQKPLPIPPILPTPVYNPPVSPLQPEEWVRVTAIVRDTLPVGATSGTLTVMGSSPGPSPGGLFYVPPRSPPFAAHPKPGVPFPVRSYRYPYQTEDYRIIRRPRLLTGENPLALPQNVVIDFRMSLPAVPSAPSEFDIVFSPSGATLNIDATSPTRSIFWLRDRTLNPPDPPGDQQLIGVNSRTGQIGAHPPDFTSGNPYSYFQDGRSSGL